MPALPITRVGPAPVPEGAVPVEVPMRDGVRLAASVHLPDGDGPFPTVLVRLPYDKDGAMAYLPLVARRFTAAGYAVVVQDVRGKFRSGGETMFAVHERDDGHDALDWVVAQPWCDGDVVMWGDSYYGMTALAAAASGHPALRAIAPRVTGTEIGRVFPTPGGATSVEPTMRRAYLAFHMVDRAAYDWPLDWSARPLADQFERFFDELGHRSPSYDADVREPGSLRPPSVEELLDAPPVPTLWTIAWYDNVAAASSWRDVRRLLADARWGPVTWLRVEASDHNNNRLADAPFAVHDQTPAEVERIAAAVTAPAIDFFGHCLRRGGEPPAKVAYEVCRGGWATAAGWPPPEARPLVLHACADTGGLAPVPPESPGSVRWTSDGVDLVPSVASRPFDVVRELHDLAPVAKRPDVVTLDTEPLEAPLVLAGPAEVTGTVRSDQRSTDLFARLLDVTPTGEAWPITHGEVRLAVGAGERGFTIPVLPTAYRLGRGHRLRLHLASTDFPEFLFNTGDGSDAWHAERAAVTTTTVSTGPAGGLALRLSVLPGRTGEDGPATS